jgi:large subunit ribosomal protein L24
MHIRKNDIVEVTRGEDRGKRGKVLKIVRDKKHKQRRVMLDGVNIMKRHRRITQQGQPGGIMDMAVPLNVANVALICPKCGQRVKVKREVHEGRRVRVCRNVDCGEVIDKI